MTAPWLDRRESITLFSSSAQNGHFTRYILAVVGRTSLQTLGIQGEVGRQLVPLAPHPPDLRLVVRLVEDAHDQLRHRLHLGRAHPARGQGGRAEAEARRHERLL